MTTPKLPRLSRRRFLAATAVAAATRGHGLVRAAEPPAAEILDLRVISHEDSVYHGWPTLTRRRNGELLVVWSGGRRAHVCPFGRVDWMRSRDEGRTWSWPRTLLDTPIDDRDAGILETSSGTLLVTTFTSLAYEASLDRLAPDSRTAADWNAVQARTTPAQRRELLNQWMLRSTDGGLSWSPPYPCLVNSPHGPTQLRDGRLVYAGKALWTGGRVGVCESDDDGVSWRWLADIPARPGDDPAEYHELHAVETAENRLVAHIRNHNTANNRETLQTESDDGGRTWSVPHPIGVWGLPSFLLRLRDGRLLMTYGHRRPPFGNQARISTDHGRSWSDPVTISGDGHGGDLGYPSTVELENGDLLTIWYEALQGKPAAVLRQARWRLR